MKHPQQIPQKLMIRTQKYATKVLTTKEDTETEKTNKTVRKQFQW